MSEVTPPAPEPAPIPQAVPAAAPLPPAYGAPGAPLPPKSVGVAYLMMLFTLVGIAGIQHFYMGKVGRGFLWLLTFGLLSIGSFIDLFTLPSQVRAVNARRAVGIR